MTELRALLSIAPFGIPAGPRMLPLAAVFALFAFCTPAQATVFSREQDIGELRLGQRVRVDDGTCPAGQIKELSGAKMTETGVLRTRKCVPRVGPKIK